MVGNIREMRSWRPKFPFPTTAVSSLWLLGLTVIVCFAAAPLWEGGISLILQENARELSRVTAFTVLQGGLSAVFAVMIALPLAIFMVSTGRRLRKFMIFCGILMYCLPSGLIANGIILALGRSGLLTQALKSMGSDIEIWRVLYSKWIVITVNISMNAPFMAVILTYTLLRIPGDQWSGARLLGLSPLKVLNAIVIPAIWRPAMLLTSLTFLMSMNSFGAISLLGSGPASETLEFAVYSNYISQGNAVTASLFALTHFVISGIVVVMIAVARNDSQKQRLAAFSDSYHDHERPLREILFINSITRNLTGVAAFTLMTLCVIPVAVIAITGTQAAMRPQTDSDVLSFLWNASIVSLLQGLAAGITVTVTAWILARAVAALSERGQLTFCRAISAVPFAGSIIPGITLAFGLNILIHSPAFPLELPRSLLVVICHAVLTLPMAASILFPRFESRVSPLRPVRYILGVPRWHWLRRVELPGLSRALITAFLVAMAMSINETAASTVLRHPSDPALNTALLQLAGHYQFDAAAMGSLFVIAITALPILAGLYYDGDHRKNA